MEKNDVFLAFYRLPFVVIIYLLLSVVYLLMVLAYWDIPRANEWWRTTT